MDILLCTDGSRQGLGAVHLGGTIAAQLKADVTLLCVVASKRHDDIEDLVGKATGIIKASGVKFNIIGRGGQLVDEMLAQMLEIEYDLVVVGYHGRSFLEKAFMGSLAARIAHEVPASVLIVRGRRDWINHVLIGISGGGFTQECADWGGRIAAAFGARVTLLHASQAPPLMYAGFEEVTETLAEFLQTDTLESQALKRAVSDLKSLGVQTFVELVRGLPERELLRLAQDRDVDLLVIGSAWAAQPMPRLFLRNITEQVLLNTQRPVLVVRPASKGAS